MSMKQIIAAINNYYITSRSLFFSLWDKKKQTTAARHATEKLQNSFLCPEALTLEALFLPKSAN